MSPTRPNKYVAHTVIGPYRLMSRVTTSQACEIWEAVREPQGSRHALKVALPARANDRGQMALMKREFNVGHRLNHPAIIRIDDYGVDKGVAYVAMEYFPSSTMKALIRQGGATWQALAQRVAQQAAEALGYVHVQGWIHRDVKPENFLIGPEGDVKLIDFGLARRVRSWWQRYFCASPKVEGTRSYMSPEQIRRGPQDQRADIYSLGCVFFELAGGKPPFTGEGANDLLMKHLRTPPPALKSINPQVQERFAALTRSMLAKEPRERPASMEEVAREVRVSGVFEAAPEVGRRSEVKK